MRRIGLILFCLATLAAGWVQAGTFGLTDGTQVSGDPVSPYKTDGVVFKTGEDSFSQRVPWDKFSQDGLKELLAEAKTDADQQMVSPLIDSLNAPAPKEIHVTVPQYPQRPTKASGVLGLFSSPVGLFILLVIYGGIIFAGYEVAYYRRRPVATVCGLAAIPIFGILSPIIYLALPSPKTHVEETMAQTEPTEMAVMPVASATPVGAIRRRPGEQAPVAAVAAAPAALATAPPVPTLPGGAPRAVVTLPAPVYYKRGDFSFNRRFFETKLAGFLRIIPAETEKDLRLRITSARGTFDGRLISKLTQTEFYFQVIKGEATADEMIPYTEIQEIEIRHKDLA